MDLKKIFIDFLNREKLLDKKLLLSISGGVDSRVLFHVALDCVIPTNIAVFHLNHRTSTSSDKAMKFVQTLCQESEITFYGFEIKKTPTSDRENFWRQERKRLAKKAQEEYSADRILTAHHATDLVETMLFRLVKGAGVSGLSPFDISTKPFWEVPKSVIENYAKEKKLEFVFDQTNEDTIFERNLLRHKVIPHLRKITPNLEKVFASESKIFSETNDFLQAEAKKIQKNRKLSLETFTNLAPIIQKEFLRSLSPNATSFNDIADCLRWLLGSPKGNSQKKLGDVILQIQNNHITWKKK